jgi:RNA polymerase sigma-70 factor, ECF subfamily
LEIEERDPPARLALAEESKLIQKAKAGDKEAFGTLYGAYVQAVYRYLLTRLSNVQVAEDLTAEVFLRAVTSLPRYTERGLPFGAWLFRIARDRLVDYYRQTARRPILDLDEGLVSQVPDPSDVADSGEQAQLLMGAIGKLTDEQRDVVQFRYMEEWSLEKTALIMNKSVNAIKALQHRALKALGRSMNDGELGKADASELRTNE